MLSMTVLTVSTTVVGPVGADSLHVEAGVLVITDCTLPRSMWGGDGAGRTETQSLLSVYGLLVLHRCAQHPARLAVVQADEHVGRRKGRGSETRWR